MRRLVYVLLFIVLLGGCTIVKREAGRMVIDSDYAKYEESKDQLERAYLNGEITYGEYQVKLDELNQERLISEKEREEILFR